MKKKNNLPVLKDAGEVRPSVYNPRKNDRERLELVALSLKKLGWLLPIYVDKEGEILSGHQRHFVSTEMLGATKVPVVVVRDMPLERRMAINVLYNRTTNDLKAVDATKRMREELMEDLGLVEEIQRLPDLEVDSEEFFPIMRVTDMRVADLVSKNGSWKDKHGICLSGQLKKAGLPVIPVVVTQDGKIVNGHPRLTYVAREGKEETIQAVVVPDAVGKVAGKFLNRLSMDFSLEERYQDYLRHNSFRRPNNRQSHLVNTYTAALLRGSSKNNSKVAKRFDVKDPEHQSAWKKFYGTTVLDFGAGLCNQTELMKGMGVDAVPFEPFFIAGGLGNGKIRPDLSREIVRAFLERVKDGTQFSSIFLSSVLNSVPFLEDRRKIIKIVASLCGAKTSVYAGSQGSKQQDDVRRKTACGVGGAKSGRNGYLALDYEPGIVVGEFSGAPKVQKFHTPSEWKLLWKEMFSYVDQYQSCSQVAVIARSPKEVEWSDLEEAIKFEFDLPYPDGSRMGLVEEAMEAFQVRLHGRAKPKTRRKREKKAS